MSEQRLPATLSPASSMSDVISSGQLLKDKLDFKVKRTAKLKFDKDENVSSATIYFEREELIINNLDQIEPLSHLIDDEEIYKYISNIHLLCPEFTRRYAASFS